MKTEGLTTRKEEKGTGRGREREREVKWYRGRDTQRDVEGERDTERDVEGEREM